MTIGPAYRYAALVDRVIDGDTIVCHIDLGLRVWLRSYKIRLVGINAAEKSTESGKAAASNLALILTPGTPVTLDTISDYKYGGEFVARVWLAGVDLNAQLVATEWAAAWDGNGSQPVPPWPRTIV